MCDVRPDRRAIQASRLSYSEWQEKYNLLHTYAEAEKRRADAAEQQAATHVEDLQRLREIARLARSTVDVFTNLRTVLRQIAEIAERG